MTEEEICRSFRLCAYPVRQVRVLAELNAVRRKDVLELLHRHGMGARITMKMREEPQMRGGASAGAWEQAYQMKLRGYPARVIEEATGIPEGSVQARWKSEAFRAERREAMKK